MPVEKQIWWEGNDNQKIYLYRIINNSGACVELLSLGASWISAYIPDRHGNLENVILGYSTKEEYLNDNFYLGSTIGRFANRIQKARFCLGGEIWQLEANDGQNSNHGGVNGFNKRIWQSSVSGSSVTFTLTDSHGAGGYPGNVTVSVKYTFNDENRLRIEFLGKSDRQTYLNLTNHAYFNLSGKGTVVDHKLMIRSDKILETNKEFIPTGNYLQVEGTPFDFKTLRKISPGLNEEHEQLRWNRGYNHCYIIEPEHSRLLRQAAQLEDPFSGRCLKLWTTYPGILFYTANYLDSSVKDSAGEPLAPYRALCLEAQYFPDTPNHPEFPTCLLNEGELYREITEYHFSS